MSQNVLSTRLIGFGGRKGSGKDAAAEALRATFGWPVESFSVAIDEAARQLDPIVDTIDHEPVRYSDYVDHYCRGDFTRAKEHPEVRRVLQRIGAFGRTIRSSIWTDRAEERMTAALTHAPGYALTGVRFPTEITMVRRHGGLLVWVSRPGHEDLSDTDVTENSVGPDDFDVVVVNDSTLAELHAKILAL